MMKIVYKYTQRVLLLGVLLLCVGSLIAQTRMLTGVVSDENGEPLPGANVLIVGTTIGVATDNNGKYTINILEKGATQLLFSYLGFESKTLKVSGNKPLNVILVEDIRSLDEVVVVGYGQMRKSDLTGAVTSVKIDESVAKNSNDVQSLMQGRAAGVQITTGDAAPGAAVSIKIRGTSSLTGSGDPLYVVDGIIMASSMEQTRSSSQYGAMSAPTNGLSGVSPQDIENIEILKDASATAIYGSLGANGVILITTKSGKWEKTKIQYSGALTTSFMANKREMANLNEYATFRSMTGSGTVETADKIEVDWQDYTVRQAWSQNHRVTLSGKSGSTYYYLSGGYMQNQGVVKTTGSDVADFRFNVDHDVNKKLKVGVRSSFFYSGLNMTQGSDPLARNNSGLVRQMTGFQPYKFKPGADVEYTSSDENNYGAAPWLKDYVDHTDEYRMMTNFFMNYRFTNEFWMRLTANMDFKKRLRSQYYGITTWLGKQESGFGTKAGQESQWSNVDLMFFHNFKKRKHRLDTTVGVTAIMSKSMNSLTTSRQFSNTTFKEEGVIYANNPIPVSFDEYLSNSLSALTRLVYNYNERFILTGTFRADATSKFAIHNRWSYFPSFAFAYRMDQEEFMRNQQLVSNAKFRIGWGLVGNQAIGAYQTQSLYQGSPISNGNGDASFMAYRIAQMTNPNLRWETTEQYNAGFDYGMFQNRLNLTLDVYYKRSYDLLQTIEMPLSAGYPVMAINRGEIANRGVEISIDGVPVQYRNFSIKVGANISFNRNKIVDVGLPIQQYGAYQWAAFTGGDIGYGNYFKQPANIFIEGQPVAQFYGVRVDGIVSHDDVTKDRTARLADYNERNGTSFASFYDIPSADALEAKGVLPTWNGNKLLQAGDPKYYDADGNGRINSSLDRTIIGNPNPLFSFGFNINMDYKNFYLSASFNGVYGNKIVNSNRMIEEDFFNSYSNITKHAYDNYWYSELDAGGNEVGRVNTSYPRVNYTGDNGMFSSFIVEDGSFLRLSNLTIGYNLKFKKSNYISAMGVSLTARNLFCLTSYSGYDPEVNSFSTDPLRYGVDWAAYPNNRTFGVGITLDF